MNVDSLPLARQIEMVFKELQEELSHASSGVVFIQIRNNVVGKFGIRHDPVDFRGGELRGVGKGLSEAQFIAFFRLAIQSLKRKNHWTHGEIQFEFALRQDSLIASVQLESNYNMSNLLLERRRY